MPRPAAALPRRAPSARPLTLRLLATAAGLAVLLPLTAPAALASDGHAGGPPAARDTLTTTADTLADAERRHAGMNELVERTAAILAKGAADLETGQAELAALKAEQAAAEVDAQHALDGAAAAKLKLGVVVSASYRSPLPQSVHLAMTSRPEQIADAVVARADLDRVQGDSQDLLRRATAARVAAQQAVRHADELTRESAAKERALAAEVERLRAVATKSEQDLAAAAAALTAAQADRQGALAAAEASARARDAERTARAAAGSYIAATCAGMPTGPQTNGMLSTASLCPLDDAPGAALRPDAATAYNALNAYSKQTRGKPLCVSSSYRSYAGQVAVFAAKPHLAAVPGRSNHGWGRAIDFGCGVERFGSAEHEWMRAHAGSFGWFHPGWAQAGGSRPEAWHWEFGAD